MAIERVDERRHQPGADQRWVEAWTLDVVQSDGSFGVSTELVLHPGRSTADLSFSIVGAWQRVVSLRDEAMAIPAAPSLELRSPGIWTEYMCQDPFEHFTVDLEAFGLALDRPEDAIGEARGERVPMGCELEWETAGLVDVGRNPWSYEIPCRVHGELLLGADNLEIDGWGWRSHRWGVPTESDRSVIRGRRCDGTWWRVLEARPMPDVTTVGRAPMRVDVGGRAYRLDQRLVSDNDGGFGWFRSLTIE